MHQTRFSEKIPYGGFSQIRSHIQCNQAREQNFFISEFEPILTHKIKSIIDKSLKFGTNLLRYTLHKLIGHEIRGCAVHC